MEIRNILFDLDGTLLPMDQDEFVNAYFGLLARKLAPRGYDPEALVKAIWAGTAAMVKNDGSCLNEDAFWMVFASIMGEHTLQDKPVFDEFYRNEFQQVQQVCGFNPMAAETIRRLREKGYRLVLATNPLFPAVATESRIRWAGLNAQDFGFFTTYENSRRCKPNPDYYRDILDRMGADAASCLMVGNDVGEDMIAGSLGMQVFLLTDCLINKNNEDISRYPNGGFEALLDFIGA